MNAERFRAVQEQSGVHQTFNQRCQRHQEFRISHLVTPAVLKCPCKSFGRELRVTTDFFTVRYLAAADDLKPESSNMFTVLYLHYHASLSSSAFIVSLQQHVDVRCAEPPLVGGQPIRD